MRNRSLVAATHLIYLRLCASALIIRSTKITATADFVHDYYRFLISLRSCTLRSASAFDAGKATARSIVGRRIRVAASGDSKSHMTSGRPDPRVEGIMLQLKKCLLLRKENGPPRHSRLSREGLQLCRLLHPLSHTQHHPGNGM